MSRNIFDLFYSDIMKTEPGISLNDPAETEHSNESVQKLESQEPSPDRASSPPSVEEIILLDDSEDSLILQPSTCSTAPMVVSWDAKEIDFNCPSLLVKGSYERIAPSPVVAQSLSCDNQPPLSFPSPERPPTNLDTVANVPFSLSEYVTVLDSPSSPEGKSLESSVPFESFKSRLHYPFDLMRRMRHLTNPNSSSCSVASEKPCPSHISVDVPASFNKPASSLKIKSMLLKSATTPNSASGSNFPEETKISQPTVTEKCVPLKSNLPRQFLDQTASRKRPNISQSEAAKIRSKYVPTPAASQAKKLKSFRPKDSYGYSPLHVAADTNNFSLVEKCISEQPSLVHSRDNCGRTPLHIACRFGRTAICKRLLDAGSDPNSVCLERGIRPLHEAILAQSVDTVKMLLEHGASPCLTSYIDEGLVATILQKNPQIEKLLKEATVPEIHPDGIILSAAYGDSLGAQRHLAMPLNEVCRSLDDKEVDVARCPCGFHRFVAKAFSIETQPRVQQSDLISRDLDMDLANIDSLTLIKKLQLLLSRFLGFIASSKSCINSIMEAIAISPPDLTRPHALYLAHMLRSYHDDLSVLHFTLGTHCLAYMRYVKNISSAVSVNKNLAFQANAHLRSVEPHVRFLLDLIWKYTVSDCNELVTSSFTNISQERTTKMMRIEVEPLMALLNLLHSNITSFRDTLQHLESDLRSNFSLPTVISSTNGGKPAVVVLRRHGDNPAMVSIPASSSGVTVTCTSKPLSAAVPPGAFSQHNC